jgi:hypothetical protein
VRAGRSAAAPAFLLESINEQIDDSVVDYCRRVPAEELPPNLIEYRARRKNETLAKSPGHPWLGHSAAGYLALVLWATCAALGLTAMTDIVFARPKFVPFVALCLVACVFVMVDFAESRTCFFIAAGRTSGRCRAFRDSIYWTRAIGVVLSITGAIAAAFIIWARGWNSPPDMNVWQATVAAVQTWWILPACAAVAVVVANFFDRPASARIKAVLNGAVAGVAVPLLAAGLIVALARLVAHVFAPALGLKAPTLSSPPPHAAFGGLLLLLQLALLYLLKALSWSGEGMKQANLGLIVPLQFCWTPGQVNKRFGIWCKRIACRLHDERPDERSPGCSICNIVGETLWREVIGLIPVFFIVLTLGLWFAAAELDWKWVQREFFAIPLWFLLPSIAAVADYLEDACHFRYLKRHSEKQPIPAVLPLVSTLFTLLKFAALVPAFLATIAAVASGTWQIAIAPETTGWRGAVAFTLSSIAICAVMLLVVSAIVYRFYAKSRRAASQAASARAQPTDTSTYLLPKA